MAPKAAATPLEDAEKELETLTAELKTLDAEAATQRARKAELAAAQEQAHGQVTLVRARLVQLKSVSDDTRGTLAKCKKEQEELQAQLASASAEFDADFGALEASRKAKERLSAAREALVAVRAELSALGSDAAKKAALQAEGEELPTDVVPAAVHALDAGEPADIWAASGATGEVPDSVRLVLQSTAVVSALHASLAVRAAEMREGLRQWGFARSATQRTEELCKSFKSSQKEMAVKASELSSEGLRLAGQAQEDRALLRKQQQEHEAAQRRFDTLNERLRILKEADSRLEAECEAARKRREEAGRAVAKLNDEYREAGVQLETQRFALAEHPAEASRRSAAAERLAKRAQEQLQQTELQVQQTKQELASFQQAKGTLLQAHDGLADVLATERKAHESIRAEHEKLHMDLSALAKHYLKDLPLIPGLEVSGDKEAADTTQPISKRPGAPFSSAAGIGGLQFGSGGDAVVWQQPQRPVDQTGEAVLAAGGRLVLSL